jgi:glutaredoxin 3
MNRLRARRVCADVSTQRTRVTLYTLSGCSSCAQARGLLHRRGIAFEEVCGDRQPDFRAFLLARTGAATVPQIVIDDDPIGGPSGLALLDRSGVLRARLASQQFPVAIVRRRWSPRRVPAFVASSMRGGLADAVALRRRAARPERPAPRAPGGRLRAARARLGRARRRSCDTRRCGPPIGATHGRCDRVERSTARTRGGGTCGITRVRPRLAGETAFR